jgi:hypothetical protein
MKGGPKGAVGFAGRPENGEGEGNGGDWRKQRLPLKADVRGKRWGQ